MPDCFNPIVTGATGAIVAAVIIALWVSIDPFPRKAQPAMLRYADGESKGDGFYSGRKILVLSCMDYRFIQSTVNFLYAKTGEDNFDYFVLAGASLGYLRPLEGIGHDWRNTFDKHVELAIMLHQIDEIVVVEHMDCGYYRVLCQLPTEDDAAFHQRERKLHYDAVQEFINYVAGRRYSGVQRCSGYIIDKDMTVSLIKSTSLPETVLVQIPAPPPPLKRFPPMWGGGDWPPYAGVGGGDWAPPKNMS